MQIKFATESVTRRGCLAVWGTETREEASTNGQNINCALWDPLKCTWSALDHIAHPIQTLGVKLASSAPSIHPLRLPCAQLVSHVAYIQLVKLPQACNPGVQVDLLDALGYVQCWCLRWWMDRMSAFVSVSMCA